jgi:hypothetical protein
MWLDAIANFSISEAMSIMVERRFWLSGAGQLPQLSIIGGI